MTRSKKCKIQKKNYTKIVDALKQKQQVAGELMELLAALNGKESVVASILG